MTIYTKKCWEIINCDHLDCLARNEPETSCWQIAERVGSFRDISNTCRDCIVYLLQKEPSGESQKVIHDILNKRGNPNEIGTGYRACILKTSSTS